jgi:hypothetical protein
VPIGEIVAQAKSPLWFAAYDDGDARRHIDGALAAGCKVICLAVEPSAKPNWQRIETIRRGLNAPIVVKGVATVQDANAALDQARRESWSRSRRGRGQDRAARGAAVDR